jgi:GNAT superfamily N-acetyltransferase
MAGHGGLDADRVRAGAARWIWVPVDATEVETDDYRLTHYTDYSSVQWSRTTRPLRDVLDEVLGHARAAGRPTLRWWVDGRTEPADTDEQLAALGLREVERLVVLALPVTAELDVPVGVEVVEVTDREGLVLAGRIQAEVFDMSPPTDAQVEDMLASVSVPEAERLIRCYVAYVDGEPVASGGSTVDGDALRFWDGSVLPAYRGRGAYRALVARRIRDARPTTADFALVKAVDDTSAPILTRLGFRPYGEQRCFTQEVELGARNA